jgi:hypothetical protein
VIYYHCATCGLDLGENDTGCANGVRVCYDCGESVEERDTDALTERLAAAEERAVAAVMTMTTIKKSLIAANDDINHVKVRTIRDSNYLYGAKNKIGRALAALTATGTERAAAEAWADDVALFILHKVIDAESLTLADIAPNLTVPDGWVSFARLWRAGFVDVVGDLVQPTERGTVAIHEMLVCMADVVEDATTESAPEQ